MTHAAPERNRTPSESHVARPDAAVAARPERSTPPRPIPGLAVRRNPTAQQQNVLDDKAERAKALSAAATKALLKRCKEIGIKPKELALIKDHIRKAEVTVNFKAYKEVNAKPLPTLLKEGGVKSFFETGASDGSNDFDGREKVERDMFGYAAVSRDSPLEERAERPKYAAVNPLTSANGGADISSYGQSALVLNDDVKKRATLTHDDSFGVKDADLVGTFDDLDHVLLQKFQGENGAKFATALLAHAKGERGDTERSAYLEVQVHDKIDVDKDVAYVRANFNEAFGTDNGTALRAMAGTKPVIWGVLGSSDQMILQPDKGPGKKHFDTMWDKVAAERRNRAEGKAFGPDGKALAPISEVVATPAMTTFWNELIALMPPANIYVSGSGQVKGSKTKNSELPQLAGGADPKTRETITAAEVKELLGRT